MICLTSRAGSVEDRQVHRTRTRHPERKSKSEGYCGSYRAGRERRNSQIPTSTQALLPTSTHSNGFCIIRVCISSSSSSRILACDRDIHVFLFLPLRSPRLEDLAALRPPRSGSWRLRKSFLIHSINQLGIFITGEANKPSKR